VAGIGTPQGLDICTKSSGWVKPSAVMNDERHENPQLAKNALDSLDSNKGGSSTGSLMT
jgi:hypothetical protein